MARDYESSEPIRFLIAGPDVTKALADSTLELAGPECFHHGPVTIRHAADAQGVAALKSLLGVPILELAPPLVDPDALYKVTAGWPNLGVPADFLRPGPTPNRDMVWEQRLSYGMRMPFTPMLILDDGPWEEEPTLEIDRRPGNVRNRAAQADYRRARA